MHVCYRYSMRYLILLILTIALAIAGFFIARNIIKWQQDPTNQSSALDYYSAEREFVDNYVRDHLSPDGGYNYWVDRDGASTDRKKYSIFQANIILWLGGLESQHPDPKNIEMIQNAANYLTRYLYKGNGEWFEFDDKDHRTRQDFFWNPRSEAYIAYALFQAGRITGVQKYTALAQETTAAARNKSIDGRIYADFGQRQDIGARFPEHMGQFQDFLQTGELEAKKFVETYDNLYRGIYGKEYVNGSETDFYFHGMAIIDKLLYGYLSGNKDTYEEGSKGREFYWSMLHDDTFKFNTNSPGESSDNGRDYHDKRLAMDMIQWTVEKDNYYRDDAVAAWRDIKGFWDREAPYGFLVNLAENRKTCFTIGMPMMMIDLIAPILADIDQPWHSDTKAWFNNQLSITIYDPDYNWNDVRYRGIGPNALTFDLKTWLGFTYGNPQIVPGPCDNCVTINVNFVKLFPGKVEIIVEDYFGNVKPFTIKVDSGLNLGQRDDLNSNSLWYYSIVTMYILAILGLSTFFFLVIYSIQIRRHKKQTLLDKQAAKISDVKVAKKVKSSKKI